MNAEIIAVGSELLLGQIVNTNAKFISEQLAFLGVNIFYQSVVGDNPNRLLQVVKVAESRSDLIILTGGLGPTKDDLTKEALAEHLNVALEYDEKALESIENFYKKRNRHMPENNRKQALIFKGSICLPNENGMAPGMVLKKGKKIYMLLPGPPSEMEPMFTKYGIPIILQDLEKVNRIESRVLRFFGIGESNLEVELEDLIEAQTNPTIAPLASDGEVSIRLTAKHESDQNRKNLLDRVEEKILDRVGQYFYGYDDTTIVKEMGNTLQDKGLTIAVAESLTGGLFQEEVTSIAGCSNWFKGGIVSYATEVKVHVLGVNEQTVRQFGVVSEQCAQEMAENVRKLMNADIGLSFTGVAGPDSLEGKEPGSVYIGISLKNKPVEARFILLSGNRETVRTRAVKSGAWEVLKRIR